MLSPRDLMRKALRRQPTDRIPTMPQICHDTPIRIYQDQDRVDWIEALKRCVEDPRLIHDYVIRLAEEIDCDGLRLFIRPEPMVVRRVDETLLVVDPGTGRRIGTIDTLGGGAFVPDEPEPAIETLAEARERLDKLVAELTDEKVDQLRQARNACPTALSPRLPGASR